MSKEEDFITALTADTVYVNDTISRNELDRLINGKHIVVIPLLSKQTTGGTRFDAYKTFSFIHIKHTYGGFSEIVEPNQTVGITVFPTGIVAISAKPWTPHSRRS